MTLLNVVLATGGVAVEKLIRDFKQRERERRRGPQTLRENPNNNLRMTGGKKFDGLRSAPT